MPIKRTLQDCIDFANSVGGECIETEYINSTVKMRWRCEKGHNMFKSFSDAKRNWCKECSYSKLRISENSIKIEVEKRNGILLSGYKNSRTKLTVKCNIDGHIWNPTWDNIKAGSWCPKCAGKTLPTIREIKQIIKSNNGTIVDASNYVSVKSKIKVKCNIDNHIWETTADYLKQGSWCPRCAGKILLTYEEIVEYACKRDAIVLRCPKKIKNTSKLKLQCKKDNHIWVPTYFSIFHNGSWCPKCAKTILKSFDEVETIVKKKGGTLLSKPKDLKRNTSILKIKCDNNHIFKTQYCYLINCGSWCPRCRVSSGQKKLSDIVSDIYEDCCENNFRRFDWLKYKNRMEIDIWVPSIKLGIEYDGIHHFKAIAYGGNKDKAKKKLKKRKKLDKLKNQLIAEHQDDIKYFIRIKYTQKITKDNVIKILSNHNIPLKKP